MPNPTVPAAAAVLPEKIPLGHPADKAIKEALDLLNDAMNLALTAAMATQRFEDEGGGSIERVLDMATDKIGLAEHELYLVLDEPIERNNDKEGADQ